MFDLLGCVMDFSRTINVNLLFHSSVHLHNIAQSPRVCPTTPPEIKALSQEHVEVLTPQDDRCSRIIPNRTDRESLTSPHP